ncbi:uncharacterized protein [Dendrobates tinctorius]|uniref:uncharacterized protein n=1 Tax=Dendrobates tinctorius TaxID=92724 RepID=UPI003CCA6B7F
MSGSKKRTRQDCFYAVCTACKVTLPSGSTYPHCRDCTQKTGAEPQEVPTNASATATAPEWATQMSQSMTRSIDNLTSTLLQALQGHVSAMNVTQQRDVRSHVQGASDSSRRKRTHRSRSSASSHSNRSSPSRERHSGSRSPRPSPDRERQCGSPQRSQTRENLRSSSPARELLSEAQDSEGICDSNSDNETETALLPCPPSNTAIVEDIVSSILRVLDISDPTPDAPEHKISFESVQKPLKVFPNHPEFQKILSKHFSQTEKKFANRKYLEAKYPFPQKDTKDWTDPPEVDPPVSRLAAQTLLSLPDSSTLKDTADRQVERMARSIFEAAGASLAPAFASVWAAKAIMAWADLLQKGLQASNPQLADQAVQIAVVADYMVHAALDSARGVAAIASNAITIRRILWLREWKADAASKKSLTNLLYFSGRLFGEKLVTMISNATGGKSTSLPQLRPKRTFKRLNQSRFRSFRNPSGWSVSRPAQNRSRPPPPPPQGQHTCGTEAGQELAVKGKPSEI